MSALFNWLNANKAAKEQATSRPMSKVEALARAYCEELGYNPDDRVAFAAAPMTVPRWTRYRDIAEAALHKESMAAALRRVGG